MIIKIPLSNLKFRIELWEVKASFRLLLRKLAYSFFVQKIITFLIYSYLLFVYKTSSKNFIGIEKIYEKIEFKKPIIFAFWHNRLMMMPFFARKVKKHFKSHNLMTLASKQYKMWSYLFMRIMESTSKWIRYHSILNRIKMN